MKYETSCLPNGEDNVVFLKLNYNPHIYILRVRGLGI